MSDSSSVGSNNSEKTKKKIISPNINDIVSGRGSGSNRHEGNLQFRKLIRDNKQLYLSRTKNEKMLVARDIYYTIESMDPPGRFLQKNPETNAWFEIGKDRALEKISQALREKNSRQRQQHQVTLSTVPVEQAQFHGYGDNRVSYGGVNNRVPPPLNRNFVSSSPTPRSDGLNIYNNPMATSRNKPSHPISDRELFLQLTQELRQARENFGGQDEPHQQTRMTLRELSQRNAALSTENLGYDPRVAGAAGFQSLEGRITGRPAPVPKPSWFYESLPSIPGVDPQPRPHSQTDLLSHQHTPFRSSLEREQFLMSRRGQQNYTNPLAPSQQLFIETGQPPSLGNPYLRLSTPSQPGGRTQPPFVTPEQLLGTSSYHTRHCEESHPQNGFMVESYNNYDLDNQHNKKKKRKNKNKKRKQKDIHELTSPEEHENLKKKRLSRSQISAPLFKRSHKEQPEGKALVDELSTDHQGTLSEKKSRVICNARENTGTQGRVASTNNDQRRGGKDSPYGILIVPNTETYDSDDDNHTDEEASKSEGWGLEALSEAASLMKR